MKHLIWTFMISIQFTCFVAFLIQIILIIAALIFKSKMNVNLNIRLESILGIIFSTMYLLYM